MANQRDGILPPNTLSTFYLSAATTELDHDGQSQRLERLNGNIVATFQKLVEEDPSCDLTPLLTYYSGDYPLRRSAVERGMPTQAKKSYIKLISKEKRRRVDQRDETPKKMSRATRADGCHPCVGSRCRSLVPR